MKNQKIAKDFLSSLKVVKRKTKRPVVFAMVGLIGSGKSTIAETLASSVGATVIEADTIRVLLRKNKQSYNLVRQITETAALLTLEMGGNVILDTDLSDGKKRQSLEKKIGRKAKVIYLRTYSNPDVMIGRLINAGYSPNDFFGGAGTEWKGENRGATVAAREMWRRTPHHYQWSRQGGGSYKLKRLRIPFLAEIDTTHEEKWRKEIKAITKKIKAL